MPFLNINSAGSCPYFYTLVANLSTRITIEEVPVPLVQLMTLPRYGTETPPRVTSPDECLQILLHTGRRRLVAHRRFAHHMATRLYTGHIVPVRLHMRSEILQRRDV
jgi:hypothetical protein